MNACVCVVWCGVCVKASSVQHCGKVVTELVSTHTHLKDTGGFPSGRLYLAHQNSLSVHD